MSGFEVDPATLRDVADKHASAESALLAADDVPGSVDGGWASAALSQILATVVSTAGELAGLNQIAAAQVLDARASYLTSDQSAAESLGGRPGGQRR